jgi:hypothetical protein
VPTRLRASPHPSGQPRGDCPYPPLPPRARVGATTGGLPLPSGTPGTPAGGGQGGRAI